MHDFNEASKAVKDAAGAVVGLAIIDIVFDVMNNVGIEAIVMSVIMILCGILLLKGSKIAYIILAIIAVLSLVGGILEILLCANVFTIDGLTANWLTAVIDVFIAICVAYLLFKKEVRTYCGF